MSEVTGGCLCTRVRYRASNPPFDAGYCHCNMCKKSLGGLFSAWVFIHKADISYTAGQPCWYRSSKNVRRCFCGNCGSPIAYFPEKLDFLAFWIGSLDDPTAFEPRAHWNTENRIPWADIHANLPEHN